MVNICVGSGNRPIPGFKNFDLFSDEHTIYSRAENLYLVSDRSTEILFTNAVFEHIFPDDYDEVLTEWKRVLSETGSIVCLGIPYFDLVAKLYLSGKLNIAKAHNFTTGVIEHCDSYEYLMGQIHKALFNHTVLKDIFESRELYSKVFNYCYPGEEYPVNLGIVASTIPLFASLDVLEKIPTIEQYIVLDSISDDN